MFQFPNFSLMDQCSKTEQARIFFSSAGGCWSQIPYGLWENRPYLGSFESTEESSSCLCSWKMRSKWSYMLQTLFQDLPRSWTSSQDLPVQTPGYQSIPSWEKTVDLPFWTAFSCFYVNISFQHVFTMFPSLLVTPLLVWVLLYFACLPQQQKPVD